MRLLTVIFGLILILTTAVLLSNGSIESLDFSALVNMNWSTSTAFHTNPISAYIETIHQTKVYAIIFDAGSTGTRIHVYKFRYSRNDTFPYVLVDELYEEVKPGLSSYANQPVQLKDGLDHLLQLAKRKIPKLLWNRTWMTLKATAGLRLLSQTQADGVLKEAEHVLAGSGFQLMPNGVSIMSGLDEGVWSWVTVNFLLRRVHSPPLSYGILDLGGGSVQITFVPTIATEADVEPKQFMHQVTLEKATVNLYSHSYLGLGLMSARFAILTDFRTENASIRSDCVPHGYQGHWRFGGVRYSVRSAAPADSSMFDRCYDKARLLVTQHVPVHNPTDLAGRHFYIFSYFYDRVKDSGESNSEIFASGQITPARFASLARNACEPAGRQAYRKPFLCLDLTYIYALLKDGFKFRDSTVLHINKKINNIELGWALGAVFDLLHQTEKV